MSSNRMHARKQFKGSYIPPNRKRSDPIPPTKLIMNNENFPSLPGNKPVVKQPTGIVCSFVEAVHLETSHPVETKTNDTIISQVVQTKIGRQIEENRIHSLWKRLLREDVQPHITDDPMYERYIQVYQVKYENTFNQEEESVYSEEEEEETDIDEY